MSESKVSDEAVEAAEAAFYGRHERGWINRPLVCPRDMRAAIEAAHPHLTASQDAEIAARDREIKARGEEMDRARKTERQLRAEVERLREELSKRPIQQFINSPEGQESIAAGAKEGRELAQKIIEIVTEPPQKDKDQ